MDALGERREEARPSEPFLERESSTMHKQIEACYDRGIIFWAIYVYRYLVGS